MMFRFRFVFLYALSSVAPLLGCWWFFSQRRRPLRQQDKEVMGVAVTADLLKSPTEKEESLREQEVLLQSHVTRCKKPKEELEGGYVDPQNQISKVFLGAETAESPNDLRIQRNSGSSTVRPEPEGKVAEGLWAEMEKGNVSLEGFESKSSCSEELVEGFSSSPAPVGLHYTENGSPWLTEECKACETEGQLQQNNIMKPCTLDTETLLSKPTCLSIDKQGYADDSWGGVGDADSMWLEVSRSSDGLMEENHAAGLVMMAEIDGFCGDTQSECPPNHSLADLVEWDIHVPSHLVGRLIGKKGRSVNFLKRNSGAKIYVFSAMRGLQMCHIEGSKAQVERALALIGDKFSELDLTNQCLARGRQLPPEAWMRLPEDELVRVTVVKVVSPAQMFIQWNESTTQCALQCLEEQMMWCYSQHEASPLPTCVRLGELCAAPGPTGGWRRAQLTNYCGHNTMQVLYLDHGGYENADIHMLQMLRSEFLSVPFQGIEVILENLGLPQATGKSPFCVEVASELEEIMGGMDLLVKCVGYHNSGVPMVHMWKMDRDELVSVNQLLVRQGYATWVETC